MNRVDVPVRHVDESATQQTAGHVGAWRPFHAPHRFSLPVAAMLLVGTVLVFLAPVLPAPGWSAAICMLALWGWWRWPQVRLPAALGFGLAWTALHGELGMRARLPAALEGEDLQVQAQVLGLPQRQAGRLRADLRLLQVPDAPAMEGRRVRVSLYGGTLELEPGSRWQLQLRLRRPRGLANPGGFDFERFALERRIAATGYIREGPSNLRLGPATGVDLLRSVLSARIAAVLGQAPEARFLQALAVADTRALDTHDWEVLRATGITHLIAISGLHVGLVAGFGALLARLLYRLVPGLGLRVPLPQSAALAALVAAGGYTALAGFGLPTVRTLAMIAAALVALALRRGAGPWQAFALALIALLALDPLATLSAGFWLSFLGVAWLVWCMPRGSVGEALRLPRPAQALRQLAHAQWVMTLGLLPLTVWFFGQASVVGPLANLVAVPWVSFVVVPLVLLGCALAAVPVLAVWPLQLAAWAMGLLWSGLLPLAGMHGALAYLPEPGLPALLLGLVGALWLLLPHGVPGRALALLLLVPLVLPARDELQHGQASLAVIDVGQGLSVLVRTRSHALLYDAGPAHGDIDLGEAVVVPTLRARGVAALDALVLSHGDGDHAGGAGAVRRAYAPGRVLAGEPRRVGDAHACVAGEGWTWDGVRFEILHPPPHFPELGNESSCVLHVQAGTQSVLLTGDISEVIEARLLRDGSAAVRSDVLLVAHHGSRSSSSAAFLAATGASMALVSVAHRSRFGHPAPEVLARLSAASIPLHSTAHAGALTLQLGDPDAGLHAQGFRQQRRRFWREH